MKSTYCSALAARLAAPISVHDLLWGDDLTLQERLLLLPNVRRAAVLIWIVPGTTESAGPQVIFTQRTAHLHDHAGQISFPGGRVDAHDNDCFATALRESAEEIGVAPHTSDIIGTLPDYHTGTSYRVTPVVAWSATRPVLNPAAFDSFEVAHLFEVPLFWLIHPHNQREEWAWVRGHLRRYWVLNWREPLPVKGHATEVLRHSRGARRSIWGATAGMLVMLGRVAPPQHLSF